MCCWGKIYCIDRESNPGLGHGKTQGYRYPTNAYLTMKSMSPSQDSLVLSDEDSDRDGSRTGCNGKGSSGVGMYNLGSSDPGEASERPV